MNAVKLLFLAIAIMVMPMAAMAQEQDIVAPYRALCMITTSEGQGSGTLISVDAQGRGLVLTCRHVANFVGNPVLCTFYWAGGGQESNGSVIAVEHGNDFNNDLALIVISKAPSGVVPRGVAGFNQAEGPWVAAGFRAGYMRITPPILTALEQPDGRIMLPTPLVKGMSGGAVFNKYGQVVGVSVGSDFVTTGIAADGVHLRKMLQENVTQ